MNYYTHFSFLLPLPSDAARTEALRVYTEILQVYLGLEADTAIPPVLVAAHETGGLFEEWSFSCEPEDHRERGARSPLATYDLWLHSEEGGVDAAAAFVQWALHEFWAHVPGMSVSFQWADTADRPRLDAYGGGAVLVTHAGIEVISSAGWLFDKLSAREESSPAPAPAPAPQPVNHFL